MSEIKNVGLTWMAKCNQLTPLPFKGLIVCLLSMQRRDEMKWLMIKGSRLSRGFYSRLSRCHVTTMGKLFTHRCLCYQAVGIIWC